MPEATLIVNPASGRASLLAAQLPAIRALLSAHGYQTKVVRTTADAGSAERCATTASQGSSLVLACGGDGTVHGVIQGLAHSEATLGVLPLGTANALARNLKLPLDPLAALNRLLGYSPRLIPLGEVTTSAERRLFAVIAGCGPDGALVHLIAAAPRLKARFGRHAYYAHALRLLFRRQWPTFEVHSRAGDGLEWRTQRAFAILASRVPDLGGLFSGLTPYASLLRPTLQVQVLRPPAQLAMAAWLVGTHFGLANPWLTTLEVAEVRCTPMDARPVYLQADAEPLGPLPFSLRLLPGALKLLMPPEGQPRRGRPAMAWRKSSPTAPM